MSLTPPKQPSEIKKYTGLLDNQEKSYKSLPTWKKQAVMLHLEGYSAPAIADELNKSPQTVRRLLNSDEAKELISTYYDFLDQEYEALYKSALSAMRDSLSAKAPLHLRFQAAKFILEKRNPTKADGDDPLSAENIVQQTINHYITQVNNYNETQQREQKILPPTGEE
jgi:IS30 family transposase